jgi:hypothetical protein
VASAVHYATAMTNRRLALGTILIGVMAVGACGKSRAKRIEEAQAICPVFDSHVKVCQQEFDKAWAAARGDDKFDAGSTCMGKTVGVGFEHPDWQHALERCTLDSKASCDAFATFSVGLVKWDGSSSVADIVAKFGK